MTIMATMHILLLYFILAISNGYVKFSNFSINPGRGGLFLEDRITHDGCDYVRRTGMSSNVTADKGNFEREKRLVGPWKRIAVQVPFILE